ncbi:hypothetical protein M758_1G237500 [Ceratodon purpureus]|nr:hypothetical protein M758_1G237500 [Ceratodon purpureus]
MMGAAGVSMAGVPMSCGIHLQEVVYTCKCRRFARPCLEGGIRRVECGSRLGSGDVVRFGFKGVRGGGVVRAQEEEKESLELEKVDEKPSESWTSSVERANAVSRIYMATFVWVSLFFGISVANNEVGGGRHGRRGPRK